MLWATRRGCHVDRTACIWLIRRFIDPEASFAFFGDPAEAPEGAELFDVVGPGSPTAGRTAPSRPCSKSTTSRTMPCCAK